MKLYISTLGEFDIKYGDKSILTGSSRTYKIHKLFKYFLTFRNKKLLPETIIDNLLSDRQSDDPKNILRTQIFRLRKIIDSLIPKGEDASKFLSINFANGYYCLETGDNILIDIDEFESYIEHGDKETNREIAMGNYQKAIHMYKGLYLSDNAYEVWLVPTRNFYQRLYLKTLYKYIELLKENDQHEKIVSSCEQALLIEPYEENIHIEMMEALFKLGQAKSALNHYEHAANILEKEMDAKPSQRFTDFIKTSQNNAQRKENLDITAIRKSLEEESSSGALLCSLDYFKFLFNIQKRKSQRNKNNDQKDYLCILTVQGNIKDVLLVLEKFLRKGDAFTSWNENQILIMLHDVKEMGTEVIKERLIEEIRNYTKISRNAIKVTFQPLISQNMV